MSSDIDKIITSTVSQLNKLCETVSVIKTEMEKLASELPEYETVIAMHGVGKTLAPQLIAEIGDIRSFPKRSSLARFAGIEPPENQSEPLCQSNHSPLFVIKCESAPEGSSPHSALSMPLRPPYSGPGGSQPPGSQEFAAAGSGYSPSRNGYFPAVRCGSPPPWRCGYSARREE